MPVLHPNEGPVDTPSLAALTSPTSTPSVTQGERERARSFPGGGQILYLPQSASGYWRTIGVVRSDGRVLTFPAPRGTFAYWDPGRTDGILTIDSQSERQLATSNWIRGRELQESASWRLDDGIFAVFSGDGTWIAEPAFNRRGRMKEGVIRVIDRTTGEVSSHRIGFTPLAWTPDGRLLVTPWDGGDIVLWDTRTDRTTSFLPGAGPAVGEIIWSPDGGRFATRVYYGKKDSRHGIAIGTMGGELTVVTRHGERWVETPTWSPNGRRIAYIVRGSGPQGHRTADLYVYDVATGSRTIVADEVSDAFWVSWSPDGRWLLLDDWTRHGWLFVAADGSRQIPYPALGSFPRWCCPSSPPIDVPIPVC